MTIFRRGAQGICAIADLVCGGNVAQATGTLDISETRTVSCKAAANGGDDSTSFELPRACTQINRHGQLYLDYTSGDADFTGAPGADVDRFAVGVTIQI